MYKVIVKVEKEYIIDEPCDTIEGAKVIAYDKAVEEFPDGTVIMRIDEIK